VPIADFIETYTNAPPVSTSNPVLHLLNFDERTGSVFLDVAKAFDTVWVEDLLFS
jgi:hypothetical protein